VSFVFWGEGKTGCPALAPMAGTATMLSWTWMSAELLLAAALAIL
jgi:hypothetical protein